MNFVPCIPINTCFTIHSSRKIEARVIVDYNELLGAGFVAVNWVRVVYYNELLVGAGFVAVNWVRVVYCIKSYWPIVHCNWLGWHWRSYGHYSRNQRNYYHAISTSWFVCWFGACATAERFVHLNFLSSAGPIFYDNHYSKWLLFWKLNVRNT